jgi:hypothetical protein
MRAGLSIFAVGASAVVGGIYGLSGSGTKIDGVNGAMIVLGGVSATIGAPMFIGGAQTAEGPTRPRSVVTRSIGQGLTILGGLGTVWGALVIAANSRGDSEGNQIGRAIGVLSILGSGIILGVGIPVWVAGAHQVPREPDTSLRSPALPKISVGAGSVTLRWVF